MLSSHSITGQFLGFLMGTMGNAGSYPPPPGIPHPSSLAHGGTHSENAQALPQKLQLRGTQIPVV